MDNEIVISYIIPAYNAEKTIEKAISRTLVSDKVEVLVVENGSTDKTYNIVEKLKKKYDRLILLQSEKGVSRARNKGISEAKGDWIAFVDADDYLLEGAVEKMLSDANEGNCDLVAYGHSAGEKENIVSEEDKMYDGKTYDIARVDMISNPTKYMQVWGKIFRRRIIADNNIKFDEELRLSEDSDFTLQYMKYAKSIKLSHSILYNYSLDNVSTMRLNDGGKTKDYIYAMKKTGRHVDGENENIKKAFDKYILMHINILMVREVFIEKRNYADKIKDMKRICQEEIFSRPIRRVRFAECTSPRMMPFMFMRLKQNWLAGIIYMIRVKQNCKREVNR